MADHTGMGENQTITMMLSLVFSHDDDEAGYRENKVGGKILLASSLTTEVSRQQHREG